MPITYNILGGPGHDNALYVQINKGYTIHRLLFDCGEDCLDSLRQYEIQAIEHLFFSHLHMDHVGGFDAFFRNNFNRVNRPNLIWGPPETARIMSHRFQGYLWNLLEHLEATWQVNDIHDAEIMHWRFLAREAFAMMHADGVTPNHGPIVTTPDYTVTALRMDHLTPSLAYIVHESPRINIDEEQLATLGLRPGEWLKYVKQRQHEEAPTLDIMGKPYDLAALREALIVKTPGHSIAYLTDFLLDDAAQERLAIALKDCTTIVCECQYREADASLALRHHHMTPTQVATLARRANVGTLVLFHVSERYRPNDWMAMLAEARAIFPNTRFADTWQFS